MARARSSTWGLKAMPVVYSKGSRKLQSDYKWKDGGLGLSRRLGQQDEGRSRGQECSWLEKEQA